MKNEQAEGFEPRTMSSIIYEKYLDQLERASLDRILDVSGRVALGVGFSAAMILGGELRHYLMANDMFALKIIAGMGLGWYRRPALEIASSVRAYVSETLNRESRKELGIPEIEAPAGVPKIDGVEVGTIAELVFLRKAWNRKDAETAGISRAESDRISKGLERVGGLVKGPNNSRVLAEGYDLAWLVTVLTNYAERGEFTAAPLPSPETGTGFSITKIENE